MLHFLQTEHTTVFSNHSLTCSLSSFKPLTHRLNHLPPSMSSKRTADSDPDDRDRDRKKRRSSQSDGAAASPPFQPAPPLHLALPPNASALAAADALPPVAFWHQTFRSHSGHRGLSVWKARWFNVRPPLSFQVYLTFDVSD